MTISPPSFSTLASASYAVLRHMGSSPAAARAELDLPAATANRLEAMFLRRPGGGLDPMRPRFARHGPHVRAVLSEGGFPALKDFCR